MTPTPRAAKAKYWLVKSEPEAFAWADLLAGKNKRTCWDGVRNYQARNFLRDGMALGDRVFFYQSCTKPLAVVGVMRVVRTSYPDPTQFVPTHPAFDPGASQQKPRWLAVDVAAEQTLARPVTLAELREMPGCAQLLLLRPHSRLSVLPVDAEAAACILARAKVPT